MDPNKYTEPRKLQEKFECPIDNLIYKTIDPMSKVCRKTGITPLMV